VVIRGGRRRRSVRLPLTDPLTLPPAARRGPHGRQQCGCKDPVRGCAL